MSDGMFRDAMNDPEFQRKAKAAIQKAASETVRKLRDAAMRDAGKCPICSGRRLGKDYRCKDCGQ